MPNLIFFDLETTGLFPSRHQICQFHAKVVRVETPFMITLVETVDHKVTFEPSRADPVALAMNGYDPQVWEACAISQLTLRQVLVTSFESYADTRLISKAGNPYYVSQLVGWNSEKFDMEFLSQLFGKTFLPVRRQSLDVMQVALAFEIKAGRSLFKDLKLATVHSTLFPGKQTSWHEAGADVQATMEVWKELTKGERL